MVAFFMSQLYCKCDAISPRAFLLLDLHLLLHGRERLALEAARSSSSFNPACSNAGGAP
jgi:hypothetical protein